MRQKRYFVFCGDKLVGRHVTISEAKQIARKIGCNLGLYGPPQGSHWSPVVHSVGSVSSKGAVKHGWISSSTIVLTREEAWGPEEK